ncbi:MAG: hypothetical protein JWM41_3145 [Gemmatimonadetes bacterium]|nr:hypothetical protein [Gemmatimonadota bacterium]
MTQHASGLFDVTITPQEATSFDTPLGRILLDKQYHGELDGQSKGEMMAFLNPGNGSRAYVAIEKVTGTLGGRSGTFALLHQGTLTSAGQALAVVVAPGSGTGALDGLEGTMTIKIVEKEHFYALDYTLPESK